MLRFIVRRLVQMVGVLVVLFAPIPAGLLDLLLLTNFSFAFLILLLTFYMGRPVEFSTFPSLLLIATLFRLSLNVAATRLILSEASAGEVIGVVAHSGQLPQMIPVTDHDERPVLIVLGAPRPPAGVEDPLEVLVRDRLVAELPHHADGVDGLPCLHESMIAHRRH